MTNNKPINPVRYLVYLILLLLVLGFVFIDQGSYLLDSVSIVIVLIPSLFLLFMTYSFGDLVQAIKAPFQKNADEAQLRMAKGLFEAYTRYCLILGVFFTVVGWITSLVWAGSPNNSLGPRISISLLTLFFSLLFIMVFSLPLRAAVVKRQGQIERQ